jgi:head-tail adaptor
MNVGQLNKRIEILRQAFKEDENLGTSEPYEEVLAKIWANISPRTGSMLNGRDAGTILSQTTHAITVRSRGDITADCRIRWKDEFGRAHMFDIDYILPPAGSRFMTIYVREETNG